MKQRDGARSARSKGAEQESHNLVGDLLRRARSPEVLAGVAGAAAAARLTRHAFEHSDDEEPETSSESEDAVDEPEFDEADESPRDEAEPQTEDEAEDEDEPEVETEDEQETEDQAEPETEDEAEPETEDEAEPEADPEAEDEGEPETDDEAAPESGMEPEQDEPRADEESETPSDRSPDRNGSLGSDDRGQLLARAREYAEELTGHPVESFSGLAQEDQGWRVGMEVVEVSRVPSTTDVLASYEVVLTEDGELVDFRRAGRYYRNATDGDAS